MSKLSLSFLGRFRALLDEEPVSSFSTNKVQALVIYLATERDEARRREALMELLWPGMPERSARHNLRQALYYLRLSIPEVAANELRLGSADPQERQTGTVPLILANRQTIQLNPRAAVDVDVWRFSALISAWQAHDHLDLLSCHTCRETLEEAAAVYRGDFLADFYLDDSNEFEEWAEIRRHNFRRKALDALETLTTIKMRQKAFSEAQSHAERQLEIDNLRESAYRQLMEILALNGRRAEALSVYETCRELMVQELGMAPAKRTTEIYERILAGDLRFDEPQPQGIRGYELKEEIGEGAYGTIYRAVQPSINREVAVKVIQRKYANDPEFIRRFEAEAQTIAHLEHPYIVPLYDYWREPEGAYLVMRLFRGGNLLNSLASGPWDAEPAVQLLDQIASALTTAHRQGIVHRDIKPANILFDETGNAYLSDFGIAKDLTQELQLTVEGAFIGTPDYTSPEQLRNEAITAAADIYSLGAVLYETLTGERPFSDVSFALRIQKHLQEPLPFISASRPDLPAQIDEVVQRATSKNPVDRYPDALSMAEAFRRAVRGDGAAAMIMPTAVPAGVEISNPYKGLRAFQENDASDFYGRESLIQQLVMRLSDFPFLAVVGPSGSGKSSLVKAGLIPALRQEAIPGSDKWFIAEMVPGTHPLEELELALLPIAVDPPPSLVEPMQKDKRGMLRTIRRILPDEQDAQLLLVIDQFEEFFTMVEDEDRRRFFLDSLLTAINSPRSPLHVVVTLRADFYDRPLQTQSTAELFKRHTEIVLPLTREELTWAIQEPARQMGVGIEGSVITAMVADIADQPGALPLLQYALTELFDERRDNRMTLAAYEDLGGVSGALAQRAEELFSTLDEAGQSTARQLFLRLVTLGEGVEDTRRRVLVSELEHLDLGTDELPSSVLRPSSSSPVPSSILDQFGSFRLLTFDHDPITREPTVEVAHEALLREWPRLRGWLDQNRDDVRLQRRLAAAAAEWAQAARDPGFLLHGSRLDLFENWAEEMDLALTYEEQAYLEASILARREREAKEEARRQQELETAQKLAATEKARAAAEQQRAEEQAQAANSLRRRALYLGLALIVAAILAVLAVMASRQSSINASLAATSAAEANSNAELAATREVEALANAELAAANEAEAVANANLALTRQAEAEEQRVIAENEAEQRALAQAEAESEAQIAFSRELAAESINNLEADPELSILLALQGLAVTRTLEAKNALNQALQKSALRQTIIPEFEDGAYFIDFHPDQQKFFLSGIRGGTLWDDKTKEAIYSIPAPLGSINGAAFSPAGELLILPIEQWDGNTPLDNPISIIDTETGQELVSFLPAAEYTQYVTVSPDGKFFATTGYENRADIWDLEATLAQGTGQLVSSLCCFDATPTRADFSPDGSQIVTNARDNETQVTVWDVSSGDPLFSLDTTNMLSVAFSPDGNYLVTGSRFDGLIQVWDVSNQELLSTTDAQYVGQIRYLEFSPDGSMVATATTTGEASLWRFSPDGLQLIRHLAGHADGILDGAFTPDGRILATASFGDGTARFWDTTAAGAAQLHALAAHDTTNSDVLFIDDESKLATVDFDGKLKVWDIVSGEAIFQVQAHEDGYWIEEVTLGPNGRQLVTVSDDGTIKVWDTNTWQLLHTLQGGIGESGSVANAGIVGVMAAAFNPDETRLATGLDNGTLLIWDTVTWELLVNRDDHHNDVVFSESPGPISKLSYSPDGKLLASASGDGTVNLREAATGEVLQVISSTPPSQIWDLDFSPDGQRLLLGRRDGVMEMWQLPADLRQAQEEKIKRLYSIQSNVTRIWSANFSPDGSQIALSGQGDNVEIRSAQDGSLQLTLQVPGGANCAYFHADGKRLVTCGEDGLVRFFALDYHEVLNLAQERVTRDLTEEECQRYLHLETCPSS